MNRAEIIDRIRARKTPWDVVIIGGGATGAGCAVDAASRGYATLLLERDDFGKGTSSRSTKLIHGGVRYLAGGNLRLVRDALRERGILLANAPHNVNRQPFIVPCRNLWEKFYYGIGLKFYDLLSGKYSLGRSAIISREETLRRLPGMNPNSVAGGIVYYDGQFDDTRLLIDLVLTADNHGAAVLNYSPVDSLIKDENGIVSGVRFIDEESGESFTARAKAIINATGAFCDDVRQMADPGAAPIIKHSRGIHLVFDRRFMPSENALIIPKTRDGRVLFAIPWHEHLLVGTTETPTEAAEIEPSAADAEIEFILETAREYLTKKPGRKDILSVFAGIRPLVRAANIENTASLSRRHLIEKGISGLITITGGKWTTYRQMSEETVDLAASQGRLPQHESVTRDLKIAKQPFHDYSADIDAHPLHPDFAYKISNVRAAVRDEMARTVEDVLARRTRILFLNARAAVGLAESVAEIMAEELDKDDEWKRTQTENFRMLAENYIVR